MILSRPIGFLHDVYYYFLKVNKMVRRFFALSNFKEPDGGCVNGLGSQRQTGRCAHTNQQRSVPSFI